MSGQLDLSIVIPIRNEEGNIEQLYAEIVDALADAFDFEIIFVDDGSSDRSPAILRRLSQQERRVLYVRLHQNYGQTAAIAAGVSMTRGRIIVTMDGDLQNDPADIPRFVERIEYGYDIVFGWRRRRRDKFFMRILPSLVANGLISRILGVRIKDFGCGIKAFRADVLRNLPIYGDMHRYIPAMISLVGARTTQIRVNHRPRIRGNSKYGISRVPKVVLDVIAIKAIQLFTVHRIVWIGGAASMAMLAAITSLIAWALMPPWQDSVVFLGFAILMSFLAISILFAGFMTQLIYRTGRYHPAPIYVTPLEADLAATKEPTPIQHER